MEENTFRRVSGETIHFDTNKQYPKVSVIVPSFNQGEFIEETLLSIIDQKYPNLELIVIDGGSTDNTIEIIRRYEPLITWWVSEKDSGQSHAINKGLEKSTGEWVAWMNSDDLYLPGAFDYIFNSIDLEKYDFLYGNACWGENLATSIDVIHEQKDKAELKDILKFAYSIAHIIASQSVFIRRSILSTAGLLDEDLHYCMDFDWYCRIFITTERRYFYEKVLSLFRSQPSSKTDSKKNNGPEEAQEVAKRYLHLLNKKQQKEVTNCLTYIKRVTEPMPKPPLGLFVLMRLAIRHGSVAWNHPHFRIQARRQLQLH